MTDNERAWKWIADTHLEQCVVESEVAALVALLAKVREEADRPASRNSARCGGGDGLNWSRSMGPVFAVFVIGLDGDSYPCETLVGLAATEQTVRERLILEHIKANPVRDKLPVMVGTRKEAFQDWTKLLTRRFLIESIPIESEAAIQHPPPTAPATRYMVCGKCLKEHFGGSEKCCSHGWDFMAGRPRGGTCSKCGAHADELHCPDGVPR